MASVIITYVLWLVGGWLGLHHFYLGRDKQVSDDPGRELVRGSDDPGREPWRQDSGSDTTQSWQERVKILEESLGEIG